MIRPYATAARSAARSRTMIRTRTIRPPPRSRRDHHHDQAPDRGGRFLQGPVRDRARAGEIITKVSFPLAKKAAYEKFRIPPRALRWSACSCQARAEIRVAVTGAGTTGVFRVKSFEEALKKRFARGAGRHDRAGRPGMTSDIHGSPEYRAHLIGVMARRAVAGATAGQRRDRAIAAASRVPSEGISRSEGFRYADFATAYCRIDCGVAGLRPPSTVSSTSSPVVRPQGRAIELRQQVVQVERIGVHLQAAVGPSATCPSADPSKLDAVVVWIAQVERLGDAVVAGAFKGDLCDDQPAQRVGEQPPRRIEDGGVVEAGRARRRRRAAAALPGVEAHVVVIAAGRDEGAPGRVKVSSKPSTPQ